MGEGTGAWRLRQKWNLRIDEYLITEGHAIAVGIKIYSLPYTYACSGGIAAKVNIRTVSYPSFRWISSSVSETLRRPPVQARPFQTPGGVKNNRSRRYRLLAFRERHWRRAFEGVAPPSYSAFRPAAPKPIRAWGLRSAELNSPNWHNCG